MEERKGSATWAMDVVPQCLAMLRNCAGAWYPVQPWGTVSFVNIL